MNILQSIFEHLYDLVGNSDPRLLSFLLHCNLVLGLGTFFSFLAFRRGNRSTAIQLLCFLAGVFIASILPVDRVVIGHRVLKTWLMFFLAVALLFMPGILPRYLAPTLGAQRRLRALIYAVLLVLCVSNYLFTKGFLWKN